MNFVRRVLATLAFILGFLTVFSAIAHGNDRIVVRDGLTGVVVPSRIVVGNNDLSISAGNGYPMPRQILKSDRSPITVWPTNDPEQEYHVVYGARLDTYLARPRDGVYGISLPDAYATRPEYREHLTRVIAEVHRVTDGRIVLEQVPDGRATIRVSVDIRHPALYDANGNLWAAALAYVRQDGDHYNTDADLVFAWSYLLTYQDPGNALLHEVGHWLGFWHSQKVDVMGPRPGGTRFERYSDNLTGIVRMMRQREPTNQFPDDGRIIGFARPKSRDGSTFFACQR